jgi:hypothetical protein
MALFSRLPWDQVPKAGTIESLTITIMRAFAERTRKRAQAMGSISRWLSISGRTNGVRHLLKYVYVTTHKNFDFQIAFLLSDAHEVAGKKRVFTADQIKKLRQRYLPETCKGWSAKSVAQPHPGALKLARKLTQGASTPLPR